MNRNDKIAVLMGGNSSERKISLMSGNAVVAGLRNAKINADAIDVRNYSILNIKKQGFNKVFIALHGRGGEDGRIQAILEFLDIPYTGSRIMASSIAIDKIRTKLLWKGFGLKSSNFIWLSHKQIRQGLDRKIKNDISMLGLPLFVKPNREGSSIGISKVNKISELPQALENALQYDKDIIIEQFLCGQEYSVGILGDTTLPTVAIKTNNKFYNYEAKYCSDNTEYCFSNDLSFDQNLKLKKLVLSAWHSLGCRGCGRIDLMTDSNGEFYLLEINTSPGMTHTSLVPLAAEKAGISFSQLVTNILELAV
ncbi:D-alanine--D-alanine ligase [Candidatus Pantoea edessiphila]|uniref:D-alanine--D-alanine ligase n=1 Tax=Candidatus Pantoea edessiphila TaxID=2044610 RepID=A0A2P5SWB3_9GAMM|nr:D-alanine--D-alanine ligase [Candidatus Pantoea edessiphila]PPI86600.1 D-alanine--D-alanine ligase [Candidatus Pantoea edessiphila]